MFYRAPTEQQTVRLRRARPVIGNLADPESFSAAADGFARFPDRWARRHCGYVDDGLSERMTDPLFDLELDLDRTSVRGRDRFLDQREMVVLQALTHERARNGKGEDIVDKAGGPHVGEPHHERRIRELGSRAGQHTRPRLERRMLRVGRHHAYSTGPFHNGGKPNGGILR